MGHYGGGYGTRIDLLTLGSNHIKCSSNYARERKVFVGSAGVESSSSSDSKQECLELARIQVQSLGSGGLRTTWKK